MPTRREMLGRYELLFRLARGGMAEVYVARLRGARGFERLVAIKRIHDELADEPDFVEMFIDEARLAGRIAHPNVVQVIELGQVDEAYFIAMEYVHGESLRALVHRHRVPPLLAARIVCDAAAGLNAAHNLCGPTGKPLELVHRDVTPQNILIGYDGNVKVADFGVASACDRVHNTVAGVMKGNYAYMSPEQTRLEPLDRRSDVFSLGIVLYEASTGKRLFRGERPKEIIDKIRSAPIPAPSTCAEGKTYPARLQGIVLRALERNPELRYQTAEALQNDLEDFLANGGGCGAHGQLRHLMSEVFATRLTRRTRLLHLNTDADGSIVVPLPTPGRRTPSTHRYPIRPVPAPTASLRRRVAASVMSVAFENTLHPYRKWVILAAAALLFIAATAVPFYRRNQRRDHALEREVPLAMASGRSARAVGTIPESHAPQRPHVATAAGTAAPPRKKVAPTKSASAASSERKRISSTAHIAQRSTPARATQRTPQHSEKRRRQATKVQRRRPQRGLFGNPYR